VTIILQALTRQLRRLRNQPVDPSRNSVSRPSTGHWLSAVSCYWSEVVVSRWPHERLALDRQNLIDDQRPPFRNRSVQPIPASACSMSQSRYNMKQSTTTTCWFSLNRLPSVFLLMLVPEENLMGQMANVISVTENQHSHKSLYAHNFDQQPYVVCAIFWSLSLGWRRLQTIHSTSDLQARFQSTLRKTNPTAFDRCPVIATSNPLTFHATNAPQKMITSSKRRSWPRTKSAEPVTSQPKKVPTQQLTRCQLPTSIHRTNIRSQASKLLFSNSC